MPKMHESVEGMGLVYFRVVSKTNDGEKQARLWLGLVNGAGTCHRDPFARHVFFSRVSIEVFQNLGSVMRARFGVTTRSTFKETLPLFST